MPKCPPSLRPRGLRIMATMLLGGLVCALSGGCLILEDDVVYPDLPRKKNSPPRINLEASMHPDTREGTIYVGGCDEFHVSVDDDDVSDTLRNLWFVDPDQNHYTSVAHSGKAVPPGTIVTRTVSAPATLFNQLSGLTDLKRHVVEVWVTDSDFEITSSGLRVVQPTPGVSDGGVDGGALTVLPTYYADSYLWMVQVVKCP